MADGAGAKAPVAGDAVERPKLATWLFGTRSGWLTLWAVTAGALLVLPLLGPVVGLGQIINDQTRWYYLAASTLLWLPLLLLAMDPASNVASGPKLLLPTLSIAILAFLTAIAVVDALSDQPQLTQLPQQVAFFSFLVMAFAARIWNAALFAYHRAQSRRSAERVAATEKAGEAAANKQAVQQEIQDYKNAESIGAIFSTFLIAGITVGAFYVGSFSSDPQLGAGLGVIVFGIVIGLFSTVVFLDWISRFKPFRALAKGLNRVAPRIRFVADFYDWIDSGLVRLGSHVAGADHLKTRTRYSILCATLVCLSLLSWFLPPPFGLVPMVFGLLVALSLSRLWSWVEEDRNMASITQFSPLAPQRVGFREDFRDETLLGFIFVLVLLPIGMMQVHEGMHHQLFEKADGAPLLDARNNPALWLGYFGFELVKALPIVDWADIYHLGAGADSIVPTRPSGMHAVFGARVLVDLILIASLLQAISIASRNSQQKSLFAVGRITRLDELVEKSALSRAIRETRVPGREISFNLKRLSEPDLVDFRNYDLGRLRQLYVTGAHDQERRVFIMQLFKERQESLDPAIVVAQNIASTHRNELELFRTFEQALAEHDSRAHEMDVQDIRLLMFELRNQSGMKAFKEQLIRVAETRIGGPAEALLETLANIAVGAPGERDQFQYTVKLAAESIRRILPRVQDPQAVADALQDARLNGPKAFGLSIVAFNSLTDALRRRLDDLQDRKKDMDKSGETSPPKN